MNFLELSNSILACPMCMSGAEGKAAMAANSAIALMLLVLVGVLSSVLSFIFYIANRAKRFSEDVPGEQ